MTCVLISVMYKSDSVCSKSNKSKTYYNEAGKTTSYRWNTYVVTSKPLVLLHSLLLVNYLRWISALAVELQPIQRVQMSHLDSVVFVGVNPKCWGYGDVWWSRAQIRKKKQQLCATCRPLRMTWSRNFNPCEIKAGLKTSCATKHNWLTAYNAEFWRKKKLEISEACIAHISQSRVPEWKWRGNYLLERSNCWHERQSTSAVPQSLIPCTGRHPTVEKGWTFEQQRDRCRPK